MGNKTHVNSKVLCHHRSPLMKKKRTKIKDGSFGLPMSQWIFPLLFIRITSPGCSLIRKKEIIMYQQHMIGRSTEFSSKWKTTEIARLERMNHRDAREPYAAHVYRQSALNTMIWHKLHIVTRPQVMYGRKTKVSFFFENWIQPYPTELSRHF